jgi:hypothetical protein
LLFREAKKLYDVLAVVDAVAALIVVAVVDVDIVVAELLNSVRIRFFDEEEDEEDETRCSANNMRRNSCGSTRTGTGGGRQYQSSLSSSVLPLEV